MAGAFFSRTHTIKYVHMYMLKGWNLDAGLLDLPGLPLQPVLRDVPGASRQRGRRGEDIFVHRRVPQRQDRTGEADRERGLHGTLVTGGDVGLAS